MSSVLIKSKKSSRSHLRSLRSFHSDSLACITPAFEQLVETACRKFQCPQKVIVWKDQKRETSVIKRLASKKNLNKSLRNKSVDTIPVYSTGRISTSQTNQTSPLQEPKSDRKTCVLKIQYDTYNKLSEVQLCKVPQVPKILMQVMAFYVPMFKHLNKITIKQCGIDVYTIHELCKILASSLVTEVCLDDSPLPEANYAVLLDATTHLKHLSLCRCNINDEVCKQIASRLDPNASEAAKNLQLLNLTSNQITDEGAKYLAQALRTNRRLRYLNLSDNRLTDEGAGYIFDTMLEFPLTHQESTARWQRHLRHLKLRYETIAKYIRDLENMGYTSSRTMTKKRRHSHKGVSIRTMSMVAVTTTSSENIKRKAEFIVNEFMGPFVDSYSEGNIRIDGECMRCLGNTTLCYLNLAYNNIHLPSLNKLLAVLMHQNDQLSSFEAGLTNVVLNGNYLPSDCEELVKIYEYFSSKSRRIEQHYKRKVSVFPYGSRTRLKPRRSRTAM